MASGTTLCSLAEVDNFILIKCLSAVVSSSNRSSPGRRCSLPDEGGRRCPRPALRVRPRLSRSRRRPEGAAVDDGARTSSRPRFAGSTHGRSPIGPPPRGRHDQIRLLRLLERRQQRVSRHVADRLQQLQAEAAADDRPERQHVPTVGAHTLEPPADDLAVRCQPTAGRRAATPPSGSGRCLLRRCSLWPNSDAPLGAVCGTLRVSS